MELCAQHRPLQTLKGIRQYVDIVRQACLNITIGPGQKKQMFVMLACLLVDGFQKGLHIFEMAKKRPQAYAGFFGYLLGRR